MRPTLPDGCNHTEGLCPSDGFFAPCSETPHRVRQLLGLRQRYRGGTQLGQQSNDVRVFGGGGEPVDECAQCEAATVHHPFDRMGTDVLY
jgi:hypothetical protein